MLHLPSELVQYPIALYTCQSLTNLHPYRSLLDFSGSLN